MKQMDLIAISLLVLAGTGMSSDINAGSELGRRLLSKARRAKAYENNDGYVNYFEGGQQDSGYYDEYYNDNDNGNNGNNNDKEQAEWQWYSNYMLLGSTWLSQYSVKFQGCYDTFKSNTEAADVEDVRLMTRQVVRFRLCPTDSCNMYTTNGCRNSYGDYIIDLSSYLKAYIGAKQSFEKWDEFEQADAYEANQDGYEEYDTNFNVHNYTQCRQSQIEMDLDDYAQIYYKQIYSNDGAGNGDGNNYDGKYYIGPYCGGQGGAILMGMFKDDACSIPADSNGGGKVYEEKTGEYLPFSDRSMIEYDCFSCLEPENYDDQYSQMAINDAKDVDVIQEFCETAYLKSGKCEKNLPSNFFNVYKEKNNNVCNYMEGIKVIREDESIVTTHRNAPGHLNSKATAALLVMLFGGGLIALSVYVYSLKSRFNRAIIQLE